jgi:hypothetical protein
LFLTLTVVAEVQSAEELEAFVEFLPHTSLSWGSNITMNRILKKGQDLKLWEKTSGWNAMNRPTKRSVWAKISTLFTTRATGTACPELGDVLAAVAFAKVI